MSSWQREMRVIVLTAGLLLAAATLGLAAENVVVVWSRDPGIPQTIVDAFQQAHPDIQIENVPVACGEISDKVGTALAAGVRIDVILAPCVANHVFYATQGYFADLTPFLERDRALLEAKNALPPVFNLTNGGVGIQFEMRAGYHVQYNADHFDEAGVARPSTEFGNSWTWSEFLEAARKLTKVDPDGTTSRYALDFGHDNLPAAAFAWAWGGDLLPPGADEAGWADHFTLVQEANIAGFEAMVELSRLGVRKPSGASHNFRNGTVSMTFRNGTGYETWEVPWGVAPFPLGPAGLVPMPTWTAPAYILKSSPAQEAAWEFVRFLVTDAGTIRTETGGLWRATPTADSWQMRLQETLNLGHTVHDAGELFEFYIRLLSEHTRLTVGETVPGVGPLIAAGNAVFWTVMDRAIRDEISVTQALEMLEPVMNAALRDALAGR